MAQFDAKIFNPQLFGRYVDRIPKTKKNELIKANVFVVNNTIKEKFSDESGGNYATLPMFGRIGRSTKNYDGNTVITSNNSKTFSRSVVVVGRADSWTEKDFSTDITGGTNFMDNVARQVSDYWEDVDQDTVLSILKGIYSMTGAGNLVFVENHTLDISGETTNNKINATTINEAIQKACGDNKRIFSLAIMHSRVATNLENLQLLEYLKYTDANGITRDLGIATINGKIVLIDDSMPVVDDKYTTYVFGSNAFDYADVGVKVPYEMDRKSDESRDLLFSRQRKVFAPFGISFTKASMATESPTSAELENGANWELVNDGSATTKEYIDHKAIPIARIISMG